MKIMCILSLKMKIMRILSLLLFCNPQDQPRLRHPLFLIRIHRQEEALGFIDRGVK